MKGFFQKPTFCPLIPIINFQSSIIIFPLIPLANPNLFPILILPKSKNMYKLNTTIKSWAEDDRPREKLSNQGRSALSDAELLAIVLGSGSRNKSAVELAQEILHFCDNNLYQLGKMNQAELMKFNGVGEAKALSIIAVLELGRRRASSDMPLNEKLNSSMKCYQYMKHHFQDLEHEEFRILGLTRGSRVIANRLISKGGRSGTIADGKLIFKEAIDMKASSFVMFHNHPSGRLEPSSADLRLTKRLVDFGKMIELPIVDHIIISDKGYYSFADNGIL